MLRQSIAKVLIQTSAHKEQARKMLSPGPLYSAVEDGQRRKGPAPRPKLPKDLSGRDGSSYVPTNVAMEEGQARAREEFLKGLGLEK